MARMFWIREILAIFLGIFWGYFQFQGSVAIVGYVFLTAFLAFIYYAKYLKVDEESVGRWDLLVEGFAPAFGTFLLCWISTYTLRHEVPRFQVPQ